MRLSIVAAALGLLTSQLSTANTISEQMDKQAKQIQSLQIQLDKLQQQSAQQKHSSMDSPFSFSSYGTVNYRSVEVFKNVQDLVPQRRGQVDVERLVAELEYQFND